MGMNRREILKYTALATGGAICTPLLSTFLSGCTTGTKESSTENALSFFNQEEFDLVKTIIDTILPKTDSPSATEVGVHEEIDAMVGTVYQEEDRNNYKSGFEALKTYLDEKDFADKNEEEKKNILLSIEASAPMEIGAEMQAYYHLKQQTIAYYLYTKEIGTKYLNYLPVPGEYQACIPLSETNGKAWHYDF